MIGDDQQGSSGGGRDRARHRPPRRRRRRDAGVRADVVAVGKLEYLGRQRELEREQQLVERPTTYLLGQVDVLPLGGFDSSATAMAQGPTRRARGEAFFKYITETLGAKHKAIIVSECGHNDRCVFTTDAVFPVIFPQ